MAKIKSRHAEPCLWEWRVFWETRNDMPVYFEEVFEPDKAKITAVQDTYILINSRRDNIKLRKDSLQFKQFVESFEGVEVYRPKRTLRFPVNGIDLSDIFPRVARSASTLVRNPTELRETLDRLSYDPIYLTVQKERHRQALGDTELELATVRVGERESWSLCVQHPVFEKVANLARRFPMENARVTGYTEFLRHVSGYF
jgi:hypothetical protein